MKGHGPDRAFRPPPQEQATSILKSRQLGYSHVRLLPKDTGVRPIVNLRRKSSTKYSINQILQNAFQILTFEKVCLTRHSRLGVFLDTPRLTLDFLVRV